MSQPDIDFLENEVADEVLPEETPAPESTPETVEKPPETPVAAVTTPAATKEDERVPLAALMAERDKRRDEARRREDLEKRLRDLEAKQPNFYEAPEEYVTTLIQQRDQAATQRLYAALEEQAREVYPDYDEVFEVVQEQAANNPALLQEILSKPNPALAAYKLGKQLREHKAMQDPAAYRASLKAEILAELKAESDAKEEARRKAEEAIPPNLADVRASKDSEVLPDDSLDSILASRKR